MAEHAQTLDYESCESVHCRLPIGVAQTPFTAVLKGKRGLKPR